MKREEPSAESPRVPWVGNVAYREPIVVVFLRACPPDRGLTHSGCQARSVVGRDGCELPWSRVV